MRKEIMYLVEHTNSIYTKIGKGASPPVPLRMRAFDGLRHTYPTFCMPGQSICTVLQLRCLADSGFNITQCQVCNKERRRAVPFEFPR